MQNGAIPLSAEGKVEAKIPWHEIELDGGGLQDNPVAWFQMVLGVTPTPWQLAYIRALLNRCAARDAN